MEIKKKLLINIMASIFFVPTVNAETLINIVDLGLRNNLSLLASDKGVQESEYNININRSNFLPSLSANAETTWNYSKTFLYNESDTSTSYNSHSYGLSLSLSIFNIRNIRDYQLARLDYNLEQLKHYSKYQSTIFDITSTYFNYLKSNAQIRATEAELKSTLMRERQITRNIEVGNTAVNEIYEALSQKESVINRLRTLEKDTQVILGELSNMVQYPVVPSQDIIENLMLEEITNLDRTSIYNDIPFNNDVLIARKTLDRGYQQLDAEKANFIPDLSVSVSYQNSDANDFDITDLTATGKSNSLTATLNVNVPLFSGGSDYYAYQKGKVAIERTDLLYQDALAIARNQLNSSILNINSIAASINRFENIVIANHASYRGIQKAYELGTRTVTDLFSAETKLFNALRDYESARYDYILEILNLEQLRGRLSISTIEHISSMMQTPALQIVSNTNQSNDPLSDIVPKHLSSRKIIPDFPKRVIN